MRAKPPQDVIGVLDLGTTKVCCMIWRSVGAGHRLAGFGLHRPSGITAGAVTSPADAETAIRTAVDRAERMAGVELDRVAVGIIGGRIATQRFGATVALEHGRVDRASVDKVMSAANGFVARDGRSVLYLDTLRTVVDDQPMTDPALGLPGQRLRVEVAAVTADTVHIDAIQSLLARCYLAAEPVPSALASALAVLRDDEFEEDGVLVVDIGAAATTLTTLWRGRLIATSTLPVGGHHLTVDLHRRLQTSLAEAERIKTLYASVLSAASDEFGRVSFSLEGEGDARVTSASRADIRRTLEPRLATFVRDAADWLRRDGGLTPSTAVVTGGGSQLVGLDAYVADRLGLRVRVALPSERTGAQSNLRLAGYAVALGLAEASVSGWSGPAEEPATTMLGSRYLGRVGGWLRQAF